MDFDQVLNEIGEFGLYQKTNYLLICIPVLFGAANSLSYVFSAGDPNYRCYIPECDLNINTTYNTDWLENAVPGEYINGIFTPDKCLKFKSKSNNNSNLISTLTPQLVCPSNEFNKNETIRCNQWVFDDEYTIVNEWKITCSENTWKLALVGSIHFAGLVVGTLISGFLADKFGRKVVFIYSIIFMSITGILQGIAGSYNSFIFFAFLNAVGTASVYPLAFIIGVEMVGPSKREMCSIILNYFYAVGEALVSLTAYLCKDWRTFQFVLSTPPLLCVAYHWFVPESVRWLIAKDQHKSAGKIIKKAAKINRKELSESLLLKFQIDLPRDYNRGTNSDSDGKEVSYNESNDNNNNSGRHQSNVFYTFKRVIRSKILIVRCMLLLYVWAVNAFVFYGLSLNSTNLSGNKYINFALVCLIEIPGYTLAWISLNKLGRRFALCGSLLLCAVTCLAGGFVNQELSWAIVTLFLIGKLGITSSFAVCYTYTAEMLPTIIRSGGVGCMSTFARFGAMIAPFVPLLGVYYKPLPLLLFACVSFSAAVLGLFLPETFRYKLPDTIEEAEAIGKKNVNT